MKLALWIAGILFTVFACRFVILIFKRLTSRENMEDLIDKMSVGFGHAADKIADKIHEGSDARREKKEEKKRQKMEERRPIVIIR